jgi:hypothetical protein
MDLMKSPGRNGSTPEANSASDGKKKASPAIPQTNVKVLPAAQVR